MADKTTKGTPTDLSGDAVEEISSNLRRLLADVFALYLKTKNFHWHISGRHFRDYHLLLDEQATQVFGMTDTIAERAQNRRHDDSLDQRYRAQPTAQRQQQRRRESARNDQRAVRRQPAADAKLASHT